MSLVTISPPDFDVVQDIAYAADHNFTGQPVYARPACYLHADAAARLATAIRLARAIDLRLLIFDAFRPTEAQWVLWNHTPDPTFLSDPRQGSPHSRGVAVDLGLADSRGRPLDMGTGFDAFTPLSFHGVTDIAPAAQQNRLVLLGLMTAAGWELYEKEWWHYQLPDAGRYPLLSDTDLEVPMMPAQSSGAP